MVRTNHELMSQVRRIFTDGRPRTPATSTCASTAIRSATGKARRWWSTPVGLRGDTMFQNTGMPHSGRPAGGGAHPPGRPRRAGGRGDHDRPQGLHRPLCQQALFQAATATGRCSNTSARRTTATPPWAASPRCCGRRRQDRRGREGRELCSSRSYSFSSRRSGGRLGSATAEDGAVSLGDAHQAAAVRTILHRVGLQGHLVARLQRGRLPALTGQAVRAAAFDRPLDQPAPLASGTLIWVQLCGLVHWNSLIVPTRVDFLGRVEHAANEWCAKADRQWRRRPRPQRPECSVSLG